MQWFVGQERVRENLLRDQEPNRQVEEKPRAPFREIKMIVRESTMIRSSIKARKTYLRMVQNVQFTNHPPKLTRMDDPVINFTKKDARRVHHPYDDALVINLTIADFNTQQALVDNGSSADILYYPAFQQIRINRE